MACVEVVQKCPTRNEQISLELRQPYSPKGLLCCCVSYEITKLCSSASSLSLQVLAAFRVSFDAPIDKTVYDNPSGSQFLDMADMSVRRLVKMAKHLKVFQALDQEDQISLLKGSVLEVLILRYV